MSEVFKEGQRVRMQGKTGIVTRGPGCEEEGIVCVFWGDDLLPTAEFLEDLEKEQDQ